MKIDEDMQVPKKKALQLLREQLQQIEQLKACRVEDPMFSKWREKTERIIANLFSQKSAQLEGFTSVSYSLMAFGEWTTDNDWHGAYLRGLKQAEAVLESLVAEVATFWEQEPAAVNSDVAANLGIIFERFHLVARQLRGRHAGRPTLSVSDEYDVQDLLHALLRLYFDDVREEEWTPSYAGGASRMDFILGEHGIVIEVKKTRSGMSVKEVGDQLLVDIMRYKAHPGTRSLYCFVYDPDGLLPNPKGMERDLSRTSDGIEVKCFIRPK